MISSRSKWLNVLSLALLSCSVLLWIVVPGRAQESTENTECLQELAVPLMEYYRDVTTFIGQHYQSEAAASTLLTTALLKFDEYQSHMEDLLREYGISQANQSKEQERQEVTACLNFVQLKIDEVEQLLRNHHLQNAGSKTTYTLVNKLKDINEGLRDMARDFAEMNVLFKSFDSKLTSVTE